ncbi:helix-turn-helix domain-containing protein [Planococcus sp. 1R117A]|uniref:helix-turn-helix domain-containing protein n=1 Tax=Planococcus sp. 1R117A TaxID=3447020 RepID=UPI003EDBE32F
MNPTLLAMSRTLAGITQKELAELLNINQSTVSCYESGNIPISEKRTEQIFDLLIELGVSDISILLINQTIKATAQAQTAIILEGEAKDGN